LSAQSSSHTIALDLLKVIGLRTKPLHIDSPTSARNWSMVWLLGMRLRLRYSASKVGSYVSSADVESAFLNSQS
jgi:hypothetical protein